MTNLTTIPTTDDADLYVKYDGQYQAQKAYLSLDLETGEMSCYVDCNIGNNTSTPRTFYGLDQEWRIPALTCQAVERLYKAVAQDCQTMLDHAEVDWEKGQGTGVLDEEAQEAHYRISRTIEGLTRTWDETDIYSVWDASDFFAPCGDVLSDCGLTPYSTDEEIEAAAQNEIAAADVHLDLDDVIEYLTEKRDESLEETMDELEIKVDYEHISIEGESVYQYDLSIPVAISDRTGETYTGSISLGVGVPEYHRGTAQASGSWKGLVDMWRLGSAWNSAGINKLERKIMNASDAYDLWDYLINELDCDKLLASH